MNSKFVGFLSRNAYNPLSLTTTSSAPSTSQSSTIPATNQTRILLLTSLPNLSHLPTRQTFHQALLDYTKSFTSTSCPLVIIVPDAGHGGAAQESWVGAGNGGDAVWDLRSVIGQDLIVNPAVRIIEWVLVQYRRAPTGPPFSLTSLSQAQIPSYGSYISGKSSQANIRSCLSG